MPTSEQYKKFEEHVEYRMSKDGRPMPLPFIILGIVGEMGELVETLERHEKFTRADVLSEMGDVLWYFQAACLDQGIPLHGMIAVDHGDSLPVILGRIAEAGKKLAWHGKTYWPHQIAALLAPLLAHLQLMSTVSGVPFGEAMEANVEKLEKRYPRGFVEGGGIRPQAVDANGSPV